MFANFFDKFTNSYYIESIVKSPLLDSAIEDIKSEPEYFEENVLLRLLETIFSRTHLMTKQQIENMSEV